MYLLQIELVKLQRHFIQCGERILVIFEGRDGAGKDGSIKRWASHPIEKPANGISNAT